MRRHPLLTPPGRGRIVSSRHRTPKQATSAAGMSAGDAFSAGVAHAVARGLYWPAEALSEATILLALKAAESLLRTRLANDQEASVALVRHALSEVHLGRRAVLVVHPRDRAHLGPPLSTLTVKEDAALTPGECVIVTDTATIDGRLSVRLDALKTVLRKLAAGS